MASTKLPIMLLLFAAIFFICLKFIISIVKGIVQGKRKSAFIRISIVAALILAIKILLSFSVSERLPVPMGSKYDNKYVINLNKVMVSNSGTKVKINKVFLDLKQVSLTLGVKGKDKLVALELKKNPADEKTLQKMQGQWLGDRWSYQYGGYGMPYKEDYFVDPLYVVCYLSNGEELIFEIKDENNVKERTEFIEINKTIDIDGRKFIIESLTRAMNYTSISAKSENQFSNLEATILNNNIESENISPSWAGGGSNYDYSFSFKPIKDGKITIKIAVKGSDKVYLVDVK